jgi:hypothetical protein
LSSACSRLCCVHPVEYAPRPAPPGVRERAAHTPTTTAAQGSSIGRIPMAGNSADNGPRTAAIVSFTTALVLVFVVYVALFDVDTTVERVLFAAIVLAALAVATWVHRVAIPTSRLSHPEKVRREQRHVGALTGVLGAALLLLVYTAAFDLDSWAEWTVFGGVCLTAVGAAIALQTRPR